MDEVTIKALGKINIGLDVTGRREDGYHLVRMIMQTVHIYDLVTIVKTGEPDISMTTNVRFLPVDQDNLCIRAAALLAEEFSLPTGVKISLSKRIPVAAGMAGGSADAAAVLFGMNKLYGLGLSMEQLQQRGLTLGADVPYCLMRGTALAEGIGEKLTELPPMMRCPVLIAKPAISVSTRWVYEQLDSLENPVHPDIDVMIEDIRAQDLHRLGSHMGNILEGVTISRYPVIRQIKELMTENGAVVAMMSGSGPTVFGFFDDEKALHQAKKVLERSKLAARVQCTTMYNTNRR
jgi:4-diphosphocytidyl-2-C-methyl-D-erythritol kinase